MNVSGTTQVYGLIGDPVTHTLSPMLHHYLAQTYHHNMVYVPFPVKQQVRQAIEGAYALGICGMNVTVPYKNAVMESLSRIDPLAQAVGAVNTLVREAHGYAGFNTDLKGLARGLQAEGIHLAEQVVVILGAGGTGRTAAFLCATQGAKKVYVLNRTYEKAEEIALHVNAYTKRNVVVPKRLSEYHTIEEEGVLVIQASSVGLSDPNGVIIEEDSFYKRLGVGYDIVYQPFTTKFMELAHKQGKPAYNGLKMLLYQGVAAYEMWNECTVEETVVDSLYELMKAKVR